MSKSCILALSRKLTWPCSIRLIFSIADIQSEQEAEFEDAEGAEEGAEDADTPLHSYPLRCSFSFTKVRIRCIYVPKGRSLTLTSCRALPPVR